jgi:translocation and assembly module TamB
MTWLARSESGSRWLLQQSLGLAPVTIEASGITGTLADELNIENLSIALPLAKVHAAEIVLNWSPGNLLAGVVAIDSIHIAELSVDVLDTENSDATSDEPTDDPVDDELFWLDFPVQINIESGQLDKLRIEDAEFDKLDLAGTIGHGRLQIETLKTQVYGTNLQVSGQLIGPDPGRLEATASWNKPAENLSGSGSFSGNIEKLGFRHVLKVPETVNFNGTIYNLFTEPELAGIADWPSVRLPGQKTLYSNAGNITVNSNFRSARLKGNNIVLLEDWPKAPMQLEALIDLQGITIDSYSLETLDGQISGSGQIDYSEGLQGQLLINGAQINTGLINSDLPGQLQFDSSLQIESADAFVINVKAAKAQIADRDFTGLGHVLWSGGKLTAINANINAGTNQLTADIKPGKQLSGSVNVNAPELSLLWPGLQGALEASIILGGSLERPQASLTAEAVSVSLGSHSLETFSLSGELQSNSRLAGNLTATGLVTDQQQLGKLNFTLAGTLADHQSTLQLAGDMVDVELHASGTWQEGQLTQSFQYGQIQPDGYASWQLEQNPELILTADSGKVSAHCWKQQEASICIDSSNWGPDSLQSKVVIDDFALATLQPLLAEGYNIDGTVDADISIMRYATGLQAELHWRQSHTLLAYADDIDEFQTVLDEVQIDLLSNEVQTNLTANLTGQQGLTMTATAKVSGPLAPESPLKATAKGRLPSIALLRPLLQRVVNPGELLGELTIDLDVAGTLADPVFTGGANLSDGSLQLLGAGVTLSGINITAQSKGTDKLLLTGQLHSGDGSAKILGEVQTTEKTGLLADIRIQGHNLASVRIPDLSLDSSPDLRLRISEDVFDISGTIKIPRATAQIRNLPKNAVPRSADVIMHAPDRAVKQQRETIVTGDVEVLLGDQVRFNSFGLNSRLDGGLKLTQTRGGFLRSSGTVRVHDGFLTGYGKELRVDRGELTFTGPLDDPLINIQVSRESIYEGRQYTIGLRLSGSAQHVKTEPFSRPAMSENDVLMFLMLDRPASTGDDASGAALALVCSVRWDRPVRSEFVIALTTASVWSRVLDPSSHWI